MVRHGSQNADQLSLDGNREWLIHGPDLTGKYGGLQGTGGLEAVYNVASGTTTGVISNLNGHAEATVVGTTVTWNSVHSSGWGPEPGNTPQALDTSHDVASSIAWRGHYVDATGYYYLGERYYTPDSGTFLSPDPLGHESSMDLYSAFDGDPINTFDPTGRCATDTSSSSGGFLGELAQVVVSLVAGALGIDEVPLSAAFGDVVGKAVVNVVLMVAVDVVVAVVAPEAEPFLIAEEIGGEAALEGGAALLEEGGAAAVADGEGLAATTEEAVEEVGVTEDALNGANVVETTVEEGAANAEATVNAVEEGAEGEVAVGKGIQTAESGGAEASSEATEAATEEAEAGGIDSEESVNSQTSDESSNVSDENTTVPGSTMDGCFVAGTLVRMADATCEQIQNVKVGEKVTSFNMETKQWEPEPVDRTFIHHVTGDIITINVGGAIITASGNHPIWVSSGRDLRSRPVVKDVSAGERTLTSRGRWVEARSLKVGDEILTADGKHPRIRSLISRQESVAVYNIRVEHDHTYAVSKIGMLVHNKAAQIKPVPRALTEKDLGIPAGSLEKLEGTFSVENGVANVRVDLIQGKIADPFTIIKNLSAAARAEGATTLRIEATLANERLYAILARRYNLVTEGSNDIITILLK